MQYIAKVRRGKMKKAIAIMLTMSVVILIISCSENSTTNSENSTSNSENSISKLHWESYDGFWALNSLDGSIPEIPGDERKASPFEIAKTKHHWESRDGASAIRTEPIQVANATAKTTFINQP